MLGENEASKPKVFVKLCYPTKTKRSTQFSSGKGKVNKHLCMIIIMMKA